MQKIFLGILGVIVVLVAIVIATHINKVPTLDEGVKAAWAQVDNQYKRRADLVPNLVATVKGYASHEKEVLTQVTEARAKVGQMQLSPEMLNNPQAFAMFEKNQGALSSALSRLMLVVERYPELKADKNFQALQSQLEGTENRISVARRDYIAAVQKYNLELRTFPGKWVASIFYPEANVKENFSATPQEQAVPKVEF
ncbi:LemA family protein [Sulfurimonas microaerophilic]|uniref:LemA family protein n=1 Tax=Sulfurimonas microaerophilic TaxID=3058392 RepID=UPI00271459EE|nr:LemA family protein [Sulfurimonas sp. hsl 1-7]